MASMKDAPHPDPDQTMRYAMLGEDAASDSEKLEKYTGEVDWPYLRKHFTSGALLYVDPSLNLVEVGQAVAKDDTATVRAWKQSGDLLKPSEPHAQYWEESGARFLAVVVSPWVLIQPLP